MSNRFNLYELNEFIIKRPDFPNPAFGALDNMGIAFFVLIVILLITKFGKGFIANVAVLAGIIIGGIVTAALGKMNFGPLAWRIVEMNSCTPSYQQESRIV